jgi:plasmid stabilization system protein ParE
MNYTVRWMPQALDDLAVAWLHATDQQAVTSAETQIDHLLARDPLGNGHYLSEGLRQIVVNPLTVFYSVDGARRVVKVSAVRYTP